MHLSNAQLVACSRLFSAGVLREFASLGRSPLFSRFAREAGLHQSRNDLPTIASAFDAAFAALKPVNRRDEYIYKAALTQRVLLGTHSLRTATMLSEFRIGSCKADLVILNGTATVYEIKSERDSLSRLSKQLEMYRKVFAKVYVIAAERFVEEILRESDPHIGVLKLSSRFQVQTVREAICGAEKICGVTLLDSLRTAEAIDVLERLGLAVPVVPNTLLRAELRKIFVQLDPSELHEAAVQVLKVHRSLSGLQDLVTALPSSLTAAALTIPLAAGERETLAAAVDAPFENALDWS
ncbi:sce7726 family protein [Comamonas terrigena]|uniref:sce7726 family protein n=1 Tax=Comamonas terrigena TaxID=32013 RepID=UPI0009F89529|nr:sce7726 family protein [Comamonas terrigena]SUY71278.1 Uncharacterised protein [Comamonas terrigena]